MKSLSWARTRTWTLPNGNMVYPKINFGRIHYTIMKGKYFMAALNDAGIQLIKDSEGCRLTAYPDPASILGKACGQHHLKITDYDQITAWQVLKGDPWTIGWGSTGSAIKPGLSWTQEKADWALKVTLREFGREVGMALSALNITPNDNQFSAMISFAYECGIDALEHVLQEVGMAGYAEKILEYDKAGGEVLQGIKIRREKEAKLFNTSGGSNATANN